MVRQAPPRILINGSSLFRTDGGGLTRTTGVDPGIVLGTR